jgi:alpha-amylase/alpha-mannosidase (GH57 family)
MNRWLSTTLILMLTLTLLLGACGSSPTAPAETAEVATAIPSTAPAEVATATAEAPAQEVATATPAAAAPAELAGEPIYLALIWHQHQPVYFKDPDTGVYQKPWVRLHAAKDYVDMAAMLTNYPDINATFNLTPSLLRQLQDLEAGAVDLYWIHTLVPADELTAEQKDFIASRFFDINPKIIARFPRYQEIADERGNSASWDTQTWLDLQVLFNLAWTDPSWLEDEPLASLVAQGRDYAEADKEVILNEHARLIAEVIPLHRRLQDAGQIEITTTPFFHPILPLLLDTDLARIAVPDIKLPPRFTYGFDAVAQVEMGVNYYTELFGQPPRGMWPAEGAVAQGIVGMVAREGIQWMASDEEVLARSLGRASFARNSQEVVADADALYRPYQVSSRNDQMYIIFRDKVISDKVGFTYSGTPGEAAAADFVSRILAIRDRLAESGATGPHLVSVILDGENAWEYYDNDGKAFLNAMYRMLSEQQAAGTIQTVTPSEFLAQFAEQPAIEELWPGSWVSPDYLTWIGEDEENRAWTYLGDVRAMLERKKLSLDPDTLARAMDAVYAAEGSDWFWWYGADQNSGDDSSFDLQFRLTLQQVYEIIGEPVPTFLKVPVIPALAQVPAAGASDLMTPVIDGVAEANEWDAAGYYTVEGGVQATPEQIISQLWYGYDRQNLYLRLDARRPWADVGTDTRVGIYLTKPGGGFEQPFTRVSVATGNEASLLGFSANGVLEVTIADGEATATFYAVDENGAYVEAATDLPVGLAGTTLEIGFPYADYGKPDAGDTFKMRAYVSEGLERDIQAVPTDGPGMLVVPDLGFTIPILTVADPMGDDHGPGSYTYPSDAVFADGSYDLIEFAVSQDDNNLVFRFTFDGPLNNDWGAPNGMGIHTLDVYVDAAEGGARLLLPGRNAALPEGSGWEFAIWAEGWTPGLYGPPAGDAPEPAPLGDARTLNIVSDPGQNRITIRLSKATLAGVLGVAVDQIDPATWGYLGVVLGQEGYPASGVWRVRDVEGTAQQWRFGGAPADINHTRIIDLAWSEGVMPTQEEMLSAYTAVASGNAGELGPDDFAQVVMVRAE